MNSIPFHFPRVADTRPALFACLVAVLLSWSCPVFGARNSQETVWKVTDTESGNVYFAQSIVVDYSCPAGGLLTARGTVKYKLAKDRHVSMAHISSDSATYPFSVPGTKSEVRGTVAGMGFITPDGPQQPVIACQKFEDVRFEDMRDQKKLTISKFIADEVKKSDIVGDWSRKK